MMSGVAPDVPAWLREALRGNDAAMLGRWRFFCQTVKQRELVCDVLYFHVVGNDVALQPTLKCFAKLRLGVHRKRLSLRANEKVAIHFALRTEHARLDGDRFSGFAQIICDLSV